MHVLMILDLTCALILAGAFLARPGVLWACGTLVALGAFLYRLERLR